MQKKYQILIITDSLGFPRLEPEVVVYDDTYIALLKQAFPNCDFIHQGMGGATIDKLITHAAYFFGSLKPDLVFVQSGIVDAAPRTTTYTEHQIIKRLPIVGNLIGKIIKKYSRQIRNYRKITYTPPDKFKRSIEHLQKNFTNVYWIGIIPATDKYEEHLPGVRKNIEIYNEILEKYGHGFVSTKTFDENDLMTDFHHLSVSGHKKMFEILSERIVTEFG